MRIKARLSWCLLLAVLVFGRVNAQLSYKVTGYSTRDGLSNDKIMSIYHDREGFMWFGTRNGINRYDGHNFITYKSVPGDNSDLKNNRIDQITEDKAGNLWLRAYDRQVYRFDKRREYFFPLAGSFHEQHVNQFAFDRIFTTQLGSVVLITGQQGIFVIADPDAGHPHPTRFANELPAAHRLPSNTINFLHEDRLHRLWIGTSRGLCRIGARSGAYVGNVDNMAPAVGKNIITAAETHDGLYFTTSDGTLLVYLKNTDKLFSVALGLGSLNAIVASHDGKYLLCAPKSGGLFSVGFKQPDAPVITKVSADGVLSIFQDGKGFYWLENTRHQIVQYNPAANSFNVAFAAVNGPHNNNAEFSRIFQNDKGIVWLNHSAGGFYYFDYLTGKQAKLISESDRSGNTFQDGMRYSFSDTPGVIWICTADGSLEKVVFKSGVTENLPEENPARQPDNDVRAVCTDGYGRLWAGTKGGRIYVYGKDKRKINDVFINNHSNVFGSVYDLFCSYDGTMWIGTKANGLFIARPAAGKPGRYTVSHFINNPTDRYSLSGNDIYDIAQDAEGQIWIGSYGKGLNRVDESSGTIRFLNNNNGFRNYPRNGYDKIRHLTIGPDGRLWIATTDGLLIMSGTKGNTDLFKFKAYNKIPGDKTSLGNNDVQFIFRDSKNRMWVLTSGGGLNKAVKRAGSDNYSFKIYTSKDGLPSDYLLSCTEDRQHKLWLATPGGIAQFDPETDKAKDYSADETFPQVELSESASLTTANGNIVIGTTAGFLDFNPLALPDRHVKANMVFTNLQIDNEDVASGKDSIINTNINYVNELKLKYNQNIISIDYTVLDFLSADKPAYFYRLRGFDSLWHNNKTAMRATYTNLPYGNYVFEVKSLNPDLYGTAPIKRLAIHILPPPWRTWWAYLIYVVLLLAAIEATRRIVSTMLGLRQKIAVEKEIGDLKMGFFTNISHELRTPLTLILNPIDEIAKREHLTDAGKAHIHAVQRNARRMVRFINQLLDLRKVESGKAALRVSEFNLVHFINGVAGYFNDVITEKHINLAVKSNREQVLVWADAEKLDIIIYNLLANAVKFTPGGKNISVTISADAGKGQIQIDVADQGIGVPEENLKDIFQLYYDVVQKSGKYKQGTGIGLAFSRELVELHKGRIFAENNAGGGLTVTITLPMGKAHFASDNVTFISDQKEEAYPAIAGYLPGEDGVKTQAPKSRNGEVKPLVLLVEDNTDLRAFLKNQLEEFYRVETADNGVAGLEKGRKHLPDLVLSDVMMPEMDGIQMLDKLKNDPLTSHIPVVLLSAKYSVESQIEGLKYGADYYITKPFDNEFLLTSIANLLRQRRKLFDLLLTGKKTIELRPSEIVITSHDETFLKKIIGIVEEKMAEADFNIDDVADALNMSRSAFYRKFKSLTDLPPVEFVREMRLKRAKQLMDAGETKISDIAFIVGFQNVKYFSTCFKAMYRLTPSEYLKEKGPKVNLKPVDE